MNKYANVNWDDATLAKTNNCWLKNGIIALAIAGAYSIFLVILRTPHLNKLLGNPNIFRAALIVHVNLSVLVWLISIICHWWNIYLDTINVKTKNIFSQLALVGSLIMAISPLLGENQPILNNYIPILENLYFLIGLSLFGVSVLTFALYVSWVWLAGRSYNTLAIYSITTALMYIAVWICFVFSSIKLQKIIEIVPLDLDFYYELLFWSGGHLLQFLYTQGLIWAWLYLTDSLKQYNPTTFSVIFILNFIISLIALLGHFYCDIIDAEFKEFYTMHMRYVGGVAPILCLLAIFYRCYCSLQKEIKFPAAFCCSSFLFMAGGIIGILISGMNLTIPAHYHGSIVGITIAFMGVAYKLIGVQQNKKAALAIYTITIGQILHITGLAIAGGYGVVRKAPEIALPLKAKMAMGIMGGGGLVAIIGGLMFVLICAKKLYFHKGKINAYNT